MLVNPLKTSYTLQRALWVPRLVWGGVCTLHVQVHTWEDLIGFRAVGINQVFLIKWNG